MRGRTLRRAAAVAAAVVVVALAWFALQVWPIFSSPGRTVIVTVHSGESMSDVAASLHHAGVIASPWAFRLDTLVQGSLVVRAGSYELHQRSSFAAVRSIIGAEPNVLSIDVSPGLTLHEVELDVAAEKGANWAVKLQRDLTAAATPSAYATGSSLEGLVGAGTYVISPSTTPEGLARDMVGRFSTEAARAGLSPSTTAEGLDAYQVVVAASIVEKEGYYPRNFGDVARVIFNRLARGGPLQMDATVLYYFQRDGGTVTPAMLQADTPYNTYRYSGLTPTPICTVSTQAIDAVLHAPPGPWLYFEVIDRAGDMKFSSTFAEQLHWESVAASNGIS